MEENVVLQVILHGEEGLEIRVGNQDKVNPLTLVGILEQVKLNILSGESGMESHNGIPATDAKKYDA
jgi:hypothetical protein